MKTKTFLKTLTNKEILQVKVSIERDYFSVTGSLYDNKRKFNKDDPYCCGCIHDEILREFPSVKPLIDLHLSNLDGSPMHTIDNGYYFLAGLVDGNLGEKYFEEKSKALEHLCSHLRVAEEKALEIVETVKSTKNPKDKFKQIIDELAKNWKIEAEKGLELFNSL